MRDTVLEYFLSYFFNYRGGCHPEAKSSETTSPPNGDRDLGTSCGDTKKDLSLCSPLVQNA